MNKLYNLDGNSKKVPPNIEGYVKAQLRDYIPDILPITRQSVEDCNKIQRDYEPHPMSSWKPSFTKGRFYRLCETKPRLKDLIYKKSYNVRVLSIENIDIYIGKTDYSSSIVSSSHRQDSLFGYNDMIIEVDLSYTVDSNGKYNESFISYTIDNSHIFTFSLEAEYSRIMDNEAKDPLSQKKSKKIEKRSG